MSADLASSYDRNTTSGALALPASVGRLPRLGFVGLGWIGANRLAAVAQSGVATVAAIADTSPAALTEAGRGSPGARQLDSFETLLTEDLDGVVIATPNELHAAQALAALESGRAVFCQKPLARTAPETRRIIAAAQRADRLLGVDLSYRWVTGVPKVRELVQSGALGRIHVIDLVFHNAYGPDKPWFYDVAQSGGGCAIDLGTHLVDLALWTLGFPVVEKITSRLYADGTVLTLPARQVDDHTIAQIDLCNGPTVRLACSWRSSAGQSCAIEAAWYGTSGGAVLRNLGGSFYDFAVEWRQGTRCAPLGSLPDAWGGRAIVNWAERLACGSRFDPEAETLANVADVIDAVYGRSQSGRI